MAVQTDTGNTSGQGAAATVPAEIAGWNWGGFLLTWIWGIGNCTYIALLALLGPIALIVAIVLGVKGNEWAWRNRRWESVDQFKKTQKVWAIWGLVLLILSLVLCLVSIILPIIAAVSAGKTMG